MYDFRESNYFMSLPQLTKESIMQSGIDFAGEDELRQFVLKQDL